MMTAMGFAIEPQRCKPLLITPTWEGFSLVGGYVNRKAPPGEPYSRRGLFSCRGNGGKET